VQLYIRFKNLNFRLKKTLIHSFSWTLLAFDCFDFLGGWVWHMKSDFTAWATPALQFCSGYFGDGVFWTIFLAGLELQSSRSQISKYLGLQACDTGTRWVFGFKLQIIKYINSHDNLNCYHKYINPSTRKLYFLLF
jgi:hypothetical protein